MWQCWAKVARMASNSMPANEPNPTQWPINGTLDLHLFRPKEVGDLVPEYLAECRKRGILQVRIVHGKGTGQLRERVHAVLRRMPEVASFGLAPEGMGGWPIYICPNTPKYVSTPDCGMRIYFSAD